MANENGNDCSVIVSVRTDFLDSSCSTFTIESNFSDPEKNSCVSRNIYKWNPDGSLFSEKKYNNNCNGFLETYYENKKLIYVHPYNNKSKLHGLAIDINKDDVVKKTRYYQGIKLYTLH